MFQYWQDVFTFFKSSFTNWIQQKGSLCHREDDDQVKNATFYLLSFFTFSLIPQTYFAFKVCNDGWHAISVGR